MTLTPRSSFVIPRVHRKMKSNTFVFHMTLKEALKGYPTAASGVSTMPFVKVLRQHVKQMCRCKRERPITTKEKCTLATSSAIQKKTGRSLMKLDTWQCTQGPQATDILLCLLPHAAGLLVNFSTAIIEPVREHLHWSFQPQAHIGIYHHFSRSQQIIQVFLHTLKKKKHFCKKMADQNLNKSIICTHIPLVKFLLT